MDVLQSRSEHDGEEKNSQPLPGIEPSIIQPVAQRYAILYYYYYYYCYETSFS
jgi:hypothetical protein